MGKLALLLHQTVCQSFRFHLYFQLKSKRKGYTQQEHNSKISKQLKRTKIDQQFSVLMKIIIKALRLKQCNHSALVSALHKNIIHY